MLMQCVYGLSPPIRPIAYIKDSHDDDYIFEAGSRYYFYMPETEDLWFLEDARTDETSLRKWATGKRTKLEGSDEGQRRYCELQGKQMALARQNRDG
jgi:hypothetical protein